MTVADINDADTPGARGLRAANLASMALNGHPTRLNPGLPQPPMQGSSSNEEQEVPVANDDSSKKPIFDPTINLGHILTAAVIAVSGFAFFSRLEQRIVVVEERQTASARQADDRDRDFREVIRLIREDVKDVQRTVNEMARAIVPKRDRN